MAVRAASVAPPPGLAMPKWESEEIGRNNNSSLMELNAGINVGEGYVAEEFQVGDKHYPCFKEDLRPHFNSALAPHSVLVQNSNSSSPNKETLSEVNGNPNITDRTRQGPGPPDNLTRSDQNRHVLGRSKNIRVGFRVLILDYFRVRVDIRSGVGSYKYTSLNPIFSFERNPTLFASLSSLFIP